MRFGAARILTHPNDRGQGRSGSSTLPTVWTHLGCVHTSVGIAVDRATDGRPAARQLAMLEPWSVGGDAVPELEVMLAAVGILAVVVASSSRWLLWTPLTPPLLALLLGIALGPYGLAAVDIPSADHQPVMSVAAELLLAVGLMAVALRHPLGRLRPIIRPVGWLVGLAMPAMAVAVAGLAGATLGVSVGVAVLLGACLAPTDPVLAAGVATGAPAERDVPVRLRELLSLESGVNDGLALPIVLVAAAIHHAGTPWGAAGTGLLQVVLGIVVGVGMGVGAGRVLRAAERHGDIEDAARLLFTLVLTFAVLGTVGVLGGNGLIGVLAAGLAHNGVVAGRDRAAEADIDESMDQFLLLPTFALLGTMLPWEGWATLGWPAAGFTVAVLVLRRLPWSVLLKRPLGLTWREALWLGWFGPIGVAAIFYLAELRTLGILDPVIWSAGTAVVVASTVVHGLSAPSGRRLLRSGAHATAERTGRT